MTLHARVSRVDDYTGELLQTLQKLEMEQAKGALNRDEQDDFLVDLRKAMEVRDLRPMRNRATFDLLLALAIFASACMLPGGLIPLRLLLLAISALSLGMAGWRLSLFLRRRAHDRRWLGSLEAAVASGKTIFDARLEPSSKG